MWFDLFLYLIYSFIYFILSEITKHVLDGQGKMFDYFFTQAKMKLNKVSMSQQLIMIMLGNVSRSLNNNLNKNNKIIFFFQYISSDIHSSSGIKMTYR